MSSSVAGTTSFELGFGALQILELAAPHRVGSRPETTTFSGTARRASAT